MKINLKKLKQNCQLFRLGTSEEHMFKVYRSKRAYDMCKSLEDLILLKPDGDLIPDEVNVKRIYPRNQNFSYQNC